MSSAVQNVSHTTNPFVVRHSGPNTTNSEQWRTFGTVSNSRSMKNIDLTRYTIPVNPAQIEAVKIINKEEFWITSESESKGKPRLFHLKLNL